MKLSFQTKVIAPVLIVLVLMPTFTLWVINRYVGGQVHAEASQVLATAAAVFRNSLEWRDRTLVARFRNLVQEPRFRAIAQLGDPATMNHHFREQLDELGEDVEFVAYAVTPQALLAAVRRDSRLPLEVLQDRAVRLVAPAFEGDTIARMTSHGGRLLTFLGLPVISRDGLAVDGVLIIGIRLHDRNLQELKSLTHTEIVLAVGAQLGGSTLPPLALEDVPALHHALARSDSAAGAAAPAIDRLSVGGERFLVLAADHTEQGEVVFQYLLLSSVERRLQALRQTQLALVALSGLGLLVSAVVIWLLIRRITQPLRDLRDGAEAVGRGDFSRRVQQYSNDECGELAAAFNRMTGNLQESRDQLESTVSTLSSTQAQLLEREQRLRESEEELRLIIESARDHAIFTLDATGGILRWNPAAERLFGYGGESVGRLGYRALFATADRQAGRPEQIIACAARDGRHAYEGWRVRADGSQFWADVTLSLLPQTEAGRPGYLEITRDITVRREAEQTLRAARDAAEAANRAKSEFVANMSHELRTPMNAIIGMSSLLLDEALPEDQRECAQTIRSSAGALLGLIDEILDLSKIEAGQLELSCQPFGLADAVEHVFDLFAASCRERGIDLAIHYGRDLPAVLLGDALRLHQVLTNLVGNAVKFTERGGVLIDVRRGPAAEGGVRLRFVVEDTGIGIPADGLDRLFKVFSQVDSSSTRRHGGTGLGLAICKRLVELMDGEIGVESMPGRGSRFWFTVSFASEGAAPELLDAQFGGLAGRRLRVQAGLMPAAAAIRQQLETWGAMVEPLGPGQAIAPRMAAPVDAIVVCVEPGAAGFAGEASGPPILHVLPRRARSPEGVTGAGRLLLPCKPRDLHRSLRALLEPAPVLPAAPRDRVTALDATFAQLRPMRILLVEDNPINSRVAIRMLERLGFQVVLAENGVLALEQLAGRSFDLVLMDLQMPEMDGLTATRRLREQVRREQPPYVMALTANVRVEDQAACREAGMHDFMSKPVQIEKLAAGLDRAFQWLQTAGAPGIVGSSAAAGDVSVESRHG